MWSLLRPLAALNAVAYLSTAILSVALHTHAPHTHASDEKTACSSCSCGHHHSHDAETSEQDESSQKPDDDHNCVVCEFIAKAPLPVEPVRIVELWTPVVSIPERELVSVQVVFLSHFWGRAPPVA